MFHLGVLNKDAKGDLLTHLAKAGIDYRIPWPPVHTQQLGYNFGDVDCTSAEKIFNRALSLPLYNSITKEAAEYVSQSVKSFFNRN